MGELHLEVLKHKLINDYRLNPYFSEMKVNYKYNTHILKREHILTKSTGVTKQSQYIDPKLKIVVDVYPNLESDSNNIKISK